MTDGRGVFPGSLERRGTTFLQLSLPCFTWMIHKIHNYNSYSKIAFCFLQHSSLIPLINNDFLVALMGTCKPKPHSTSPKGEKFDDGMKFIFQHPALLLWKPLRQTLLLTVLQRDGHLYGLCTAASSRGEWHISWETTVDSKWTEGRQGRQVIQSSLEYNALARKVMCSIHEKRDSRPLPSKATVCSSLHVQTPPSRRHLGRGGTVRRRWKIRKKH